MVDELLDQYVTDELPPPEREQVEQHFFKSQQRLDKLECALALKRHKSELNARKADTVETSRWRRFFSPVWPARSAPYARLAVVLLAVLVCGIGLWAAFFRQSDVNRGLLALQAAYKEQRPIKARISGFAYAPLANT